MSATRQRLPKAQKLETAIKSIVEKTILMGKLEEAKVRETLEDFGISIKHIEPCQIEESITRLYGRFGEVHQWGPRERAIIQNVKNLLVNLCMEREGSCGDSKLHEIQTEFGEFKPDPDQLS
ncbi:MAG: hypothetical protein QXG98_00110 [Candidatus Micrarchaeia archaeon]